MNSRMKLSTAIRLGAMLHPQHFGAYVALNDRDQIVATCALGAAGTAGYSYDDRFLFGVTTCPACQLKYVELRRTLIIHLNDTHRWTREQIADWVEASEPLPDPAAVPQHEQLVKVVV